MTADDQRTRREALDFVLIFARPPDISLSANEGAWRTFDAGPRDLSAKEQLAAELGLSDQVEREVDRIRREDASDTDEQRVRDLYEDVVRIFGSDITVEVAGVNDDGVVVIRAGDRTFFRDGGSMSTFACHRVIGGGKLEATLWNRAGFRADRQIIEGPGSDDSPR